MSQVKALLKAARQSLVENDPENVIYLTDKILEDYDQDNYFAYIFQGKALTVLEKYKDAMNCYLKASQLNADDLTSWKGMLLIVKEADNIAAFFKVILGYAQALAKKNENLLEVANLIKVYKTNFGTKIEDFEEQYSRFLLPGTELSDLVGPMLDKPYTYALNLAKILSTKEQALIKGSIRTFRLSTLKILTDEQQEKLNAILWRIYKDSEIPSLYHLAINSCDDDDRRRDTEELLLKYEMECLNVSPNNVKDQLKAEIYDMISGMVVVKHPSRYAWDLYFDWCDLKSINDLDLDTVSSYIKLFGTTGLGSVFYAFVFSDISPFDVKKVKQYLVEEKKSKAKKIAKAKILVTEETQEADAESEEEAKSALETIEKDEDKDETINSLSNDEIIDFLSEGLKDASSSILAHRIAVSYYIHLKEYETAISHSNSLLNMLRKAVVATSHQFPNSKKDTFLNLAIGYTYYESPKNFPKALRLYDHILNSSPDEVRAKVGKALIVMEANKFSEAEVLLRDVVKEYPENHEALLNYSWAQIQMHNFEEGRKGLQTVFDNSEGTSTNAYELRASLLWKLGQSYIIELDQSAIEDQTEIKVIIKQAFDFFLRVLKQMTTYAPSYSSLGFIYLKYYDNKPKALKCFYKAFELDSAEVNAAYELVKDFSDRCDWSLVEMFSQRIIDSQQARKVLSTSQDPSWPYRMLGCVCLEEQNDSKAIEHFQNSVRVNSADIESWLGLGEAYLSCGRLESASKVFTHVIELDEDNWQAKYMFAVVQTSMGDYQESVYQLKSLSFVKANESCILISLLEALILKAEHELEGGFLGRFLDTSLQAIDSIKSALKIEARSSKAWKGLVDVLRLLLRVETHLSKVPVETLLSIIDLSKDLNNSLIESFPEEDALSHDSILEASASGKVFESSTYLLVLAARAGLKCIPNTAAKALKASSVYNVGMTYLEVYKFLNKSLFRDSAIKYLKKAVELESNNADFWVALGNASLTKNSKVSQHCFIKASVLAPKESSIWTNLAVLYLQYGDISLAQDCFLRAQSIAPQLSVPWSGQALIADALGEKERAAHLYTHSLVVSNGKNPMSMLLYGLSVLKKLVRNEADVRMLDLIQEVNLATFSLLNYLKYHESDTLALNITVSIIERINDFETGIKLANKLCEVLEGIYEDSEDPNILVQYAKAKSQESRLFLGMRDYESAVMSAQTALDLLGDTDDLTEEIQRCILSSYTVMGLALFFNGEYVESLEKFNTCREISPESERILITISQLLCQQEEDQSAIDLLMEHLEQYGSSLLVILTLAAVSMVNQIDSYYPAVKEELCKLPLSSLIKDVFHDVPFVISEINKRMDTDSDLNSKVWQRSAFLFPADISVWNNLSNSVALNVALNSKKVDSITLSESYVKSGELREIQRALFLNPASVHGYRALKDCI